MKTRFILVTIALILVVGFIAADEKSRPGRISSEEINTESSAPELANIVVLCARDEEEKFKKEWSKYVAQNDLRGDELQKTISWVSDEAAIQRRKDGHMSGDDSDDKAWKAKRQKLMDDLARRARML